MASQKFTKVTLFFNCKLLYGGENKIFASKSEMVSKLTQISDGKKEINFINGRTVPFSKEFSMHFKWEEFSTYRNNPFNYPNYAVFTDGTINRTFGYFVTSSNTKNLPSDTVELFFKYDSFINNSDVIKNLKNKPIERITLDGFVSNARGIEYTYFVDNEFEPSVQINKFNPPYDSQYAEDIYIKFNGAKYKQSIYNNCNIVFIKYILDETANIEFRYMSDTSFVDLFPLKVVYIPFCLIDNEGKIILDDTLYVHPITLMDEEKTFATLDNQFFKLANFYLFGLNNQYYRDAIKYLDSKAVSKTLTCECSTLNCYRIASERTRLFFISANVNDITKINDIDLPNFGFFCNKDGKQSFYDLDNQYKLTYGEIMKIREGDDSVDNIAKTIGCLHIYPFNYKTLLLQGNETKLIPDYNETKAQIPDNARQCRLISRGQCNNTFRYYYYRNSSNVNLKPKELILDESSSLPISKNSLELFLQQNSNQIQNGIKYAQLQKNLNDNRISANAVVGATGIIANLASGNIAGAITSTGKTATETYFGYENEKLKISKLIDSNKAKQKDLENTNGDVNLGSPNILTRVGKENLPLVLNYYAFIKYEVDLITLFFNKYGVFYNGIIENVFSQNRQNFDFFKFSEFDEQEISIQPNDERHEVYNQLISGVRIWYNLDKMGSENILNTPISFYNN